MTLVYLVRHGSHDRLHSILCGRMPGVHLSESGHAEAKGAARLLRASGVQTILTSPLERARETAGYIGDTHGLTPRVEERLNEVDVGAWTGQPFEALAGNEIWRLWNADRQAWAPPDGEGMPEAQARITSLLDDFRSSEYGPIVLVSHLDIIRGAVLSVLGLPLNSYALFDIGPASVTTLSLWPGGGKVVALNVGAEHHQSAEKDNSRHDR